MGFCVWLHHSWDSFQLAESSGEAWLHVTLNLTLIHDQTPGCQSEKETHVHFVQLTVLVYKLTIFPPTSLSRSLSLSPPRSLSRPPVLWPLRSSWASWMAWVTTSPSPRKPDDKDTGHRGGEEKWGTRWWWRQKRGRGQQSVRSETHHTLFQTSSLTCRI